MGPIHQAVIAFIKEAVASGGSPELATAFAGLTDEQMLRMMFANVRGHDAKRGLRLSNFGRRVMMRFFQGYEVAMPPDDTLKTHYILYLDARARMPYYCGKDGYVVFDHHLGIKLKLATGRIDILMEMEGWRE